MAKKNKSPNVANATSNGRRQSFGLAAPDAGTVELVGDFTHWQEEPIPMEKASDGVWRTEVELAPGEHRYRFLVNGEWRDDPECSTWVPNPFGTQNAVRRVVGSGSPELSRS